MFSGALGVVDFNGRFQWVSKSLLASNCEDPSKDQEKVLSILKEFLFQEGLKKPKTL